jgi:DNA-binding transcriptional ArsR family regulator
MNISREEATTWAGWFKALGDPTRILILHLLVTAGRPLNVGEIVDALDVGQSTISHHLQILGETCLGRLPLTVPWDDVATSCDPGGVC